MIIRLFIVALAAVVGTAASAATFDVSNPTEFQTALTTAQNNGEDDTINVQAGTYNINTNGTLTYTANLGESYSLFIYGADSTTVILDGNAQVPILRIDTTAVTSGASVGIEVTNMTFQNGFAGGATPNGGALAIEVIESVIASITGSEFYFNNAAGDGGAIYAEGNFLEGLYLRDLTIERNQAFGTDASRSGDGGGAAIRATWPTYVFLEDIDFFDNSANRFGGGLEVEGVDDATGAQNVGLYDIMFERNLAVGTNGSGGGASLLAMDVWIDLVGFISNSATDIGGGLHLREHSRNRTINSGFLNNTAAVGGGFGTDPWNGSGIVFEHTTFTGNAATDFGGGLFLVRGLPNPQIYFYNNIVWGNTGPVGADIYVDDDPDDVGGDQVTEVTLVNNIYADFTTKCREDAGCTDRVTETDNINANPLLAADLHLLTGSPAIDAGLNTGHPMYPVVTTDFDGDSRPFDGDGDTVATTDIGIDEYVGGVPQAADLAVTKTDSPDPVVAGGNITYTVTITNNGPGDATNAGLIDQLDADTTFVSVDPLSDCMHSAGVITCLFDTITSGSSEVVTIVVQTDGQAQVQTTVSNTADVGAVTSDPVGTNNTATEQTTVILPLPDTADLAITMTDSADPVVSGGLWFSYDITVTNNGPDVATGVAVTDIVPMGLTDVIASVNIGLGTWSSADCIVNGLAVTCRTGDLAVDEQGLVRIEAIPEPVQADTDLVNTATVSGDQVDPVAGNNSATETTTLTPPESDLRVTVDATPASPNVGERVTYGITVTNGGPSHNTDVTLTITLPEMGTFVSASSSQGTCSAPVKGIIDCDLGDVPLSFTPPTVQVVFTAPDVAASMVLTASASGSAADPSGGNNTDSGSVSVIDTVELIIEGESEGGGAIGWLGMLLLAGVVIAFRNLRTRSFAVPCLFAMAVLMLVPAGNAVAQGSWYVQGSFGWVDLDYDESDLTSDLASLGWTISSPDVDSDEQAFKIMGGFAFNEYVAVEAGYVDLGEVETRFGATVLPTEIDDILSDTYSIHPYQGDGLVAAGVLHWPVNPDVVSLYLKAGVFMWESETEVRVIQGGTGSVSGDDDGTDLMWGVGAEWKINPTWSLTAEWERYEMNEWLDVPFIGVKINF